MEYREMLHTIEKGKPINVVYYRTRSIEKWNIKYEMDQFVIYIIQSMKQKAIKYSVWSIEKCNIV